MRRDVRAFTLIEVTAALSIAGLALLGGVMLLDQLGDVSNRITVARRTTMTGSNGSRLLRELIANAIPSPDTTHGLAGTEHAVSLWTSCRVADGWTKPCMVSMILDQRGDSTVVAARLPDDAALRLLAIAGAAELRYLDAAPDTTWAPRWSSALGLPRAIALATQSDTIVYPLGVRYE